MLGFRSLRRIGALGALSLTVTMSGCAQSVASWIVATRDHQGARSLESLRYKDAAKAFRLALKIDSTDVPAREGFVDAQAGLAEAFYQHSQFKDALLALNAAQEIDAQNVRIAGLKVDVANARLKSEIVRSNYGEYQATTQALLRGYTALHVQENEAIYRLKRFGYTYDTADLTRAIRSSMELESESTKLTARLEQLRTLASAGTITTENGVNATTNGSASLLPLP